MCVIGRGSELLVRPEWGVFFTSTSAQPMTRLSPFLFAGCLAMCEPCRSLGFASRHQEVDARPSRVSYHHDLPGLKTWPGWEHSSSLVYSDSEVGRWLEAHPSQTHTPSQYTSATEEEDERLAPVKATVSCRRRWTYTSYLPTNL